jgi:hypothetical protein
MGKTIASKAKDKGKSNDKNKFRDKVPKILKAGEKGGKGKKKVYNFNSKIIYYLEMVKNQIKGKGQ